ncbi:hypothetical protein V1523DRAFT_76496 [Lipomyces doorenjongii]
MRTSTSEVTTFKEAGLARKLYVIMSRRHQQLPYASFFHSNSRTHNMRYAVLISSAFLITAASQFVNADQVKGQRLPEKLTHRTPEKATWPWSKRLEEHSVKEKLHQPIKFEKKKEERKEEKEEKQKEREEEKDEEEEEEEEKEEKEREEEEEEEEGKKKSKKKKILTKIMTPTVPCMPTRTVTVILTTMPCMPTKTITVTVLG